MTNQQVGDPYSSDGGSNNDGGRRAGKRNMVSIDSSSPSTVSSGQDLFMPSGAKKSKKKPQQKEAQKEKVPSVPMTPQQIGDFCKELQRLETDSSLGLTTKSALSHLDKILEHTQLGKTTDCKSMQRAWTSAFKAASQLKHASVKEVNDLVMSYLQKGESLTLHPDFPNRNVSLQAYLNGLQDFKKAHEHDIHHAQQTFLDAQISKTRKELDAASKPQKPKKPRTAFEFYKLSQKNKYPDLDEADREVLLGEKFDALDSDALEIYENLASGY